MKSLILEYIETKDDKVAFKIKEQSHRCEEFGENGNNFNAFNGIRIESQIYPASYNNFNDWIIYMQGSETNEDNMTVHVFPQKWSKVKEAVQEYNTYFGFTGKCIIGEEPEMIIPKEMFILD